MILGLSMHPDGECSDAHGPEMQQLTLMSRQDYARWHSYELHVVTQGVPGIPKDKVFSWHSHACLTEAPGPLCVGTVCTAAWSQCLYSHHFEETIPLFPCVQLMVRSALSSACHTAAPFSLPTSFCPHCQTGVC